MKKRCLICDDLLPRSRFHKNARKKDGLRDRCKKCAAKYHRKHYQKNRKRYIRMARARKLAWVKETQERINRLKDRPCADCGHKFHPVAMDFDHVNGKKVQSISYMLIGSWKRLEAELAKCELVCSNCHRVRTWMRRRSKAGMAER